MRANSPIVFAVTVFALCPLSAFAAEPGFPDADFGPEHTGAHDLGGDSVAALPVRLAFDHTGRIVVGATVRGGGGGDRDINVIRLTSDGLLDTSFNGGAWVDVSYATASDNTLAGLAVQSDLEILVAGSWVRTGNDYDFEDGNTGRWSSTSP